MGKSKVEINRDRYTRHRALINVYKVRKQCVDCRKNGDTEPWPGHALEFDHLPGAVKLFNIGQKVHYSLATIMAEIAKCEVVCKAHHEIRTWERWADEALEA